MDQNSLQNEKKEKKKKEYGSKDPIKSETKEHKLNQSKQLI